jgi:hypothetical protein
MPGPKPSRSTTDSGIFTPLHPLEYEVIRKLRSHPSVKISSLVVRRIPEGVCLQGVLETNPEGEDFLQLLHEIEDVTNVVNQLVCCHEPPPKG